MMVRFPNTCQVRDDLAVCCIPKNASGAIKAALLLSVGADLAEGVQEHPALRRRHPEQADGAVAAFLRDPVDRAVSTWRHKLCRDAAPPSASALLRAGFRLWMSLDDYVEALGHLGTGHDPHTLPQAAFLPDRLDFAGRVEHLAGDWTELRARVSWLGPIRVSGAVKRTALIPARVRGRLIDLYREDWERWQATSGSA